jgi:hypothetical protein
VGPFKLLIAEISRTAVPRLLGLLLCHACVCVWGGCSPPDTLLVITKKTRRFAVHVADCAKYLSFYSRHANQFCCRFTIRMLLLSRKLFLNLDLAANLCAKLTCLSRIRILMCILPLFLLLNLMQMQTVSEEASIASGTFLGTESLIP